MRYLKKITLIAAGVLFSLFFIFAFTFNTDSQADGRLYELRVYYAPEGKLEDLNARFRNHTLRLFEKHGMKNIGYWIPLENPENKLIYILSYPDRGARDKSWKAFMEDPEWKKAHAASERDGKLVSKVENIFMKPTDFSPSITPEPKKSNVFELRTYYAEPQKLDNLMNRFRNHTINLFNKYGMENIGYWKPVEGEEGADNTLIYILGHESKEGGEQAFTAFRVDTDWVAAKEASEAKGPLVKKVESVYMRPTDYSPIK